jgi:actin-related protein 9
MSFSSRKHMILKQLGLKRAQNESAILVNIFPGLPRSAHEEISRIFFERLNFAAVSVLERPMAQLYAANSLSGVVVDINRTHTDITPVYDGIPVHAARCTLPLGSDDCERYLAQLLRSNTAVMAALASTAPDKLQTELMALARQTWDAGLVIVAESAAPTEDEGVTDIAAVLVAGKEKAVIESGMKKRANAKASAAELARAKEIEALDLVTLQFRGQEITLGKERHRLCDPLFNPSVLQGIPENVEAMASLEQRLRKAKADGPGTLTSLQELVGHSVSLVDYDQRQYIYQGLFVTGDMCSHVKGSDSLLLCSAFIDSGCACRPWPSIADTLIPLHPWNQRPTRQCSASLHYRPQSARLFCRIPRGRGRLRRLFGRQRCRKGMKTR